MLRFLFITSFILPVLSFQPGIAQEGQPDVEHEGRPGVEQEGGPGFRQTEGYTDNDLLWFRTETAEISGMAGETARPQPRVIEGRVSDAGTGESLAGATIYFKGLITGIVTGSDGYFMISVPAGIKALLFSHPGYRSRQIEIGQSTLLHVLLTREVTEPYRQVSTGYLTETARDITGSVAIVNATDIMKMPWSDASMMLQGRVAGVNISDAGSVYGMPRVRIRGFSTLRGSEPLYVIDGMPADISSLNPHDIASIQVLKDAASASIFGARGGNGVVVITTRQGETGKSRIELDYRYGLSFVSESDFPELLDPAEMGELYWLQMKGAGREYGEGNWSHPQYGNGLEPVIPEYIMANVNGSRTGGAALEAMKVSDPGLFAWYTDPANYDANTHQIVKAGNTDWFDEVYNPASVHDLQLSASGGGRKLNYFLSAGYYDRNHVSDRYSYFTRYTIRTNASYNGQRLRFGEQLQLSYSEGANAGNGNAWNMPSLCPVYDIAGNPASSAVPGILGTGGGNPVTDAWRNRFDRIYAYELLGNAFAEINLQSHLVLRSSLGLNYLTTTDKDYIMPTFEHAENVPPPARLVRQWEDRYDWSFTNTLAYERVFNRHHINLMAGTEAIRTYVGSYTGTRLAPEIDEDATSFPFNPSFTGSTETHSWFSVFGRMDYKYADRYLVTVSVRHDETTELSTAESNAWFPSVALGWRLSREEFLDQVPWLDELKLRLGYGRTGNVNTTLETVATVNAGIDLALFSAYQSDLNLHIDFFAKRSENLLVFEPFPFQTVVSDGEMQNHGIEISVSKAGHIGGAITYGLSGYFTSYRNRVLRLTDNPTTSLSGGATRMGFATNTMQGYPLSMFYGYRIEGFFNSQEEVDTYKSFVTSTWLPPEVGRWKLKDMNGDHRINDYDRTMIGDPHPDFQLGMNLLLGYRNLDFFCFMLWSQGGEIFNLMRYNVDFNTFEFNRSARMLYEAWTPGDVNAKLPKSDLNDIYSNKYITDYFVEDATYLRLKQVQIGYTFRPEMLSRFRISRLRFYLQGENLWTAMGEYTGLDPAPGMAGDNDLSLGMYAGTTPAPRQVIVGIELGF